MSWALFSLGLAILAWIIPLLFIKTGGQHMTTPRSIELLDNEEDKATNL